MNLCLSNCFANQFSVLIKMKDPEVAESYQEELAGKFAPLLLLDQDPQDLCDVFTDTLEKTAEEKLGKASPIKKPWIHQRCWRHVM